MLNNNTVEPIDQMGISLDFRDCNGKWFVRTYSSNGALLEAISGGLLEGMEAGTEELMAIRLGGQFVWTALVCNEAISLEDLSGFFG